MGQGDRKMQVRVDGFTRFCLAAISVLLTLLVIGLWGKTAWPERDARADDPFVGSSVQRKAQLDAQEKTNEKLDELIRLLKSGDAKIQVINPPGEGEGKARTEGNVGKEKTK